MAALCEHNRLPLREIREELRNYRTTGDILERARRTSVKALDKAFSNPYFERLEEPPNATGLPGNEKRRCPDGAAQHCGCTFWPLLG
jgi:hypothetical protein